MHKQYYYYSNYVKKEICKNSMFKSNFIKTNYYKYQALNILIELKQFRVIKYIKMN